MNEPKKSLGQHWLKDKAALAHIVDLAELTESDTVLEIGPGMGDLTKLLAAKAGKVVAVELDEKLAANLPKADNLQAVSADILEYDLTELPASYKVVANIPYYLTGKLLRTLIESSNSPSKMVLLLQKEVAQRITAQPGDMSVLAVSVQLKYQTKLGEGIPASLFHPPPKVDSQVLVLDKREASLFEITDEKQFFQVVKAGFSGRRKKLRGSLSAGLRIDKPEADELLEKAGVDGNLRAQNLSLEDWHKICRALQAG